MNEYNNTDEITLKELILKLIEFKKEIFRNWLWILLVALPLAGYMYYKAASTPVQYKAELTFMVSEDEGGGMSGMAGILGQFGFGGRGGKSNPLTMLDFLKTRKISEKVLFKKITINNREDYIANHIIENRKKNNNWYNLPWYKTFYKKPSSLIDFRFENDNVDNFSRKENLVLKKLMRGTVGSKGKLNTSYDEMTGIMKMYYMNSDESLSYSITDNYYDELSDFYFNNTVEKQQINYNLIKAKTDSISNILNSKEYQLAKFEDSNKGLITRKDQLSESRMRREILKLSSMYAEATKNLEMADFALNLKKPIIQLIDRPTVPLSIIKESKFKAFIMGLLIGLFISVLIIVFRKVLRDTLAS